MEALQAMDMNKFIIIAPTFLVVVYLVTTIQKRLSNSKHANLGLIIPIVCFIAATVLAFKPLFTAGTSEEGMISAAIMVWLTFNVPTLAFMIPYFAARKSRKTAEYLQDAKLKSDEETESDVQSDENSVQ